MNLFNLGSLLVSKPDMVLNMACKCPYSSFNTPLYKVLPLNQVEIFLCNLTSIVCNMYLSKYLIKHDLSNIAVREVNKKKDRKRNLIPFQIGFYYIIQYFVSMFYFMITFSNNQLDVGTRAFLNALYADIHHCLITPLIVLISSKDAQIHLKNMLLNLKDTFANGYLFMYRRIPQTFGSVGRC